MPTRPDRPLRFQSALKSNQVFDNLRARGRDWRESATPEELRKIGVTGLQVELEDDTFAMRWGGNVSPIYSPALKGRIEDTKSGSEIYAGFGLMPVTIAEAVFFIAIPIQLLLRWNWIGSWIIAGLLGLLLIRLLLSGRGRTETFKSHLLIVLNDALRNSRVVENRAFTQPVATNPP